MSPPSNKSPYRLLVEGPDDMWTIINILTRHGYNWDDTSTVRPYVEPAGGVEKLLDKDMISSALKTYTRLGIVVDSDFPPTNRWRQVRNVLESLGISMPVAPAPAGTIVQGKKPDQLVGIWLMPDNSQPGRVEEFIEKLIPVGHPVWPHAQVSTQAARALGAQLRDLDQLKGALHAWLAWQEDPGLPFGAAVATHVLKHDSPEALNFVSWFKRCFT